MEAIAIVTPASRLAHGEAEDPSETMTWMRQGACTAADPDIFFPDQGRNTADSARAVCVTCPVAVDCLDYAIVHGIDHGVFGGLTPAERVGAEP